MGDRYELRMACIYCNMMNDVYYAPTCGFNTFRCTYCGRANLIKSTTQVIKAEETTGDILFDSFMAETNVGWNDEDIKRIKKECKKTAKEIRMMNEELDEVK